MTPETPLRLARKPSAGLLLLLLIALLVSGCDIEITFEPGAPATATTTTQTVAPKPAGTARVMTYNIQNFSAEAASHGDRIPKLRQIISDINPDVVALQEIDDRAALELIFPPDQWTIIIDDDSRSNQDLAFAVRKPWIIRNAPADLDADDEHFLANGHDLESFFPIRRDALFVEIATSDNKPAFTAINVHAKARVGGRAKTARRRVGASRHLVTAVRKKMTRENVVLLGDFNDSPDDTSLNILETGDPFADAGQNRWPSDFLVNLHQPLWEKGMVTLGAQDDRLDRQTGLLNITYENARARNHDNMHRDVNTGPILFDQVLVSPNLAGSPPRAGEIYRKPIAVTGPGFSRPSDHLPAYADILIP